jgi:preprotein translocase subunit SecA
MSYIKNSIKLKRYLKRLNGCTIEYDLAPYLDVLAKINALIPGLANKTDGQLKDESLALIIKARAGVSLDDLLVESFALAAETIWRVLKQRPFDEQIIGGIVMHRAKLAEMQTGEGKTLTAVFPAYLNALAGKGVHVLTFNDYLARRDAQWMGPVYEFLGLTVGFVQERMITADRKKAYGAGITYCTAKEAGFDFLRDSLCYDAENIAHHDFNFAIVDEADSILIDEARVPLIIAGNQDVFGDKEAKDKKLNNMAGLVRTLEEKKDWEFDEYSRNINLTENGIKRAEHLLSCGNLYEEENFELLAMLSYALHAEYLLHKNEDYIVRNGKAELVDEFTGRVANKRRWPDGLQAAVEAKENLPVQSKGVILNSITLQHFIQLYPKRCGMTATAQRAEEEFRNFYKLRVVVVPPHKPCVRKDLHDVVFRSGKQKHEALLAEIISAHATKRPVLVGTRSVEESAALADALQKQGVVCEVLNAKRDEFEAQIIAQAGSLGAITISTNMAGRGTDIRLGGADETEKKQIADLGGLYVIGANKHESQRIDNQLRGRAGRQGDPGSSRFFISLEDELFVKYRLHELLPARYTGGRQSDPIDNPVVGSEINRLQRIIEGQNSEIKMTMFRYSFLVEQQRKIFFDMRRGILLGTWAPDFFRQRSPERFSRLGAKFGEVRLAAECTSLALFHHDKHWCRYLAEMTELREGIHLRRMGGQDPLYEFQKLSIHIFEIMQMHIESDMIKAFDAITENVADTSLPGTKAPSATWTYLINDNPFDPMLEIQLKGNIGLSAWAGLLWPLTALYFLVRRIGKKKENKYL